MWPTPERPPSMSWPANPGPADPAGWSGPRGVDGDSDPKLWSGGLGQGSIYEVDFLAEKVNELVQQGVLESVYGGGGGASGIKPETMKYHQKELAKLVGPVAATLLKDTAAKMGHDIGNFPAEGVGELLDRISGFIQDKGQAGE